MRGLQLTPGGSDVIVFSHPNHELAIFGLLQRLRPRLIYLTEGGDRGRVQETLRGLARLGLAEGADFLNYSETALYDALLQGNLALYREIAHQRSISARASQVRRSRTASASV